MVSQLPPASRAALDALIRALSQDLAATTGADGVERTAHAERLFAIALAQLDGARIFASGGAGNHAEPESGGGSRRNGRDRRENAEEQQADTPKPAPDEDDDADTDRSQSSFSSRRRGLLADEVIIDYALHHARLFSIDEIRHVLGTRGIKLPRASLVTKLSRMVDAEILQRAFRGAYERGPRAKVELERTQRWR